MKKFFVALLLLLLVLSLCACSSEQTQQEQPGQTGEENNTAEGGDEKLTIAMVPQIKGNEYFTACYEGAVKASDELGIDFIYDGPTDGRVDRQIELIETFISDGVDAIIVSPNDSDTIVPTLQKAMEAGITVLTFDVDANSGARDWFVNPADAELIGQALVNCMVDQVGSEEFDYLVLCESLSDAGQKSWTDAAVAYAQENLPGLNFLEIKQCTQSQDQAYTTAKDLLKVYPDVQGIITVGSVCFPGVIEAVNDSGLKGKIAVQGMGTPNEIRNYLEDGSIVYDVLWNPIDLGYAAIYAAYETVNGTFAPDATEIALGSLGTLTVTENKEIMLGNPFVFTKENVGDFDF